MRVDAVEALHDLVVAADTAEVQRARLERAVSRWSRDLSTPSEAVALAGAVRADLAGSARQLEILDLVTQLAVTALAERQVTEALVDALTGLASRSRMDDEGEHLLALSRRSGSPLTAVVLDVDGLKQVNDQQGHGAGDAALTEVGRAVREHLRRADRAFRWGGDEFVLLLPDACAKDARMVVDRIQQSCGTPTSVGIATDDDLPTDAGFAALLAAADADLYSRRSLVRAALAPPRRRRNPFAGASAGVYLTALALTAGLLGWVGATLAGVSGPGAAQPRQTTQGFGQGQVHVPVAAEPLPATRVVTAGVGSRAPLGSAPTSRHVVAPAQPQSAPVTLPRTATPAVPTVVTAPIPDAPPASGSGSLVGGVVRTVGELLHAVL